MGNAMLVLALVLVRLADVVKRSLCVRNPHLLCGLMFAAVFL